MNEYHKLNDELIDAFMQYQWNLDNPFPNTISREDLIKKYQSDVIFYAKVNQIVSGVMRIVTKHWKV